MSTTLCFLNNIYNSLQMVTAAQCRAARGLLQWTRDRLASEASIHANTITSFELEQRSPIPANIAALRGALEAAGVEFIPENGGGPGVRLRK
jgi:transcriptional regulator with XRE-family HTH domain